MNQTLSHVDAHGQANMVDMSNKSATTRIATAEGYVTMQAETLELILSNNSHKVDVFSVARITGIQAAKKYSNYNSLCPPQTLNKVQVDFEPQVKHKRVRIVAKCKIIGSTGVEMEALTAVAVAAISIRDRCKAVDPLMQTHDIKLLSKEGDKSGIWTRSIA